MTTHDLLPKNVLHANVAYLRSAARYTTLLYCFPSDPEFLITRPVQMVVRSWLPSHHPSQNPVYTSN